MSESTAVVPAPAAKKTKKVAAKKSGGLRTGQVRILKVLVKAKGPIPRRRLLDLAEIKSQGNDVLGSTTSGPEQGGKDWGFPSLLSLGHVKEVLVDLDGSKQKNYIITASGKKAFEKAE